MGRDTITIPTCTFPGCNNKHSTKGYCKGHYNQFRQGKVLTVLHDRNHFRCHYCHKLYPKSQLWKEYRYGKSDTMKKGYVYLNRYCSEQCYNDQMMKIRLYTSIAQLKRLKEHQDRKDDPDKLTFEFMVGLITEGGEV